MKNRWIVTMLVLLVSTPVRADLFNNSYAVVIGISSYQNANSWEKLDNAENDAKAMDDFLTGQGFQVKRFVGPDATKSNITSYLEDTLAPKLTQNDRFVFYFSGHGNTRSLGGGDRGYLIPYDGDAEKSSTWIAMEQLRELAVKLGNARHELFILDSCFGGLFATKGSAAEISAGTPNYIKEVTSSPARQYLTAGGANQETPANSNLDKYKKYSYYTAYILKGLRDGAADAHPDGFITASELNAYLESAAATEYNTPRGGHFPGHEQGDFVFRSSKKGITPVFVVGVTRSETKGNTDEEHWRLLATAGEDGLKSYLRLHPNGKWADEARDRIARLQPKPSAVTLTQAEKDRLESEWQREQQHAISSSVVKTVSKEEQAQIDYEWEKTKGSGQTKTIEDFLRMNPVGTHVPAVQQRLSELRAQGK